MHSYTTPAILVLPIESVDPDYHAWLMAETAGGGSGRPRMQSRAAVSGESRSRLVRMRPRPRGDERLMVRDQYVTRAVDRGLERRVFAAIGAADAVDLSRGRPWP